MKRRIPGMEKSSRKLDTTLTCDADVTRLWQTVINPLGWHEHRLYLMFVDEHRVVLPQIVQIDEMPAGLDREDARHFAAGFAHLVSAERLGSLAILSVRPGAGGLNDIDRATCRHLYEAAHEARLPLELIHVGTDTAITAAPMDEVLPLRAS
jgi:hypothetical protein